MRYEYPGNLKEYIDVCQKMINEFSVVQLGIPDDIISILILAKLTREHWNIVNNIIMNESIVFFLSLTLKKLQELVYMKDIQNPTTSSSSKLDSKKTEATALKTEAKKKVVQFPCSPGYHHPKATHSEWKCWKLSDKQCIAARPKDGEAHASAVGIETASHEPELESDYVKVSAFISFGSLENKPIILDSGASHHMVNDPKIFTKLREVNIKINTGNKKQRVKAMAMGEVSIKDDAGKILILREVLLTPDLTTVGQLH
jgi:hypothetical protein